MKTNTPSNPTKNHKEGDDAIFSPEEEKFFLDCTKKLSLGAVLRHFLPGFSVSPQPICRKGIEKFIVGEGKNKSCPVCIRGKCHTYLQLQGWHFCTKCASCNFVDIVRRHDILHPEKRRWKNRVSKQDILSELEKLAYDQTTHTASVVRQTTNIIQNTIPS